MLVVGCCTRGTCLVLALRWSPGGHTVISGDPEVVKHFLKDAFDTQLGLTGPGPFGKLALTYDQMASGMGSASFKGQAE